ncbi:10695_t:CDS:2 [Ambispora leptoticha]|uniref:10695_t:CDS:1 n=1 Tax=Ambispora leptoticha TaxID=144679 RepID=A0A9N9AAE5_9GLOM|nr:10695_t:CDS:2 [Ambispora leptoticha]
MLPLRWKKTDTNTDASIMELYWFNHPQGCASLVENDPSDKRLDISSKPVTAKNTATNAPAPVTPKTTTFNAPEPVTPTSNAPPVTPKATAANAPVHVIPTPEVVTFKSSISNSPEPIITDTNNENLSNNNTNKISGNLLESSVIDGSKTSLITTVTPTTTTQMPGTVISFTVNASQPASTPTSIASTQKVGNAGGASSNAEKNNDFKILRNVVVGLAMLVGMGF